MSNLQIKQNKRRKRQSNINEHEPSSAWSISLLFLLILLSNAVVCVVIGLALHGFSIWAFLATLACLAFGLGCIAFGVLAEFAWLEWIIGFTDGLISGVSGWLWTKHIGTISDNVGERGASVLWLVLGVPSYVTGCLMALGIISI